MATEYDLSIFPANKFEPGGDVSSDTYALMVVTWTIVEPKYAEFVVTYDHFEQHGDAINDGYELLEAKHLIEVSKLFPGHIFVLRAYTTEYHYYTVYYAHNGKTCEGKLTEDDIYGVYGQIDRYALGLPRDPSAPKRDEWIEIGPAQIHVQETDEGVIVDVWSRQGEPDAPFETLTVAFSDLVTADEPEEDEDAMCACAICGEPCALKDMESSFIGSICPECVGPAQEMEGVF